jgi:hypothetical protein
MLHEAHPGDPEVSQEDYDNTAVTAPTYTAARSLRSSSMSAAAGHW